MIPYVLGDSQLQLGGVRACLFALPERLSSVFLEESASCTARGLIVHASIFLVVATSLRLQPVTAAQVSVTDVEVVLVVPAETVVPNKLLVKQRDASAGEQSVGLGPGFILPPG
jgi:hypothetical protein